MKVIRKDLSVLCDVNEEMVKMGKRKTRVAEDQEKRKKY